MNDRPIHIHIEGHWDLTADEVWPDGIPDEWTAADVATAIKAEGSVMWLIDNWNLQPAVEVTTPNAAYAGDDVLFGVPPSRLERAVAYESR